MSLTPEQIRSYVKDDPLFNHLLDNTIQSKNPLITLCLELTVDDYNKTIGYTTTYTLETFPSKTCLLYGTLYHLANGEAERHLRNNVNYSAQGINAALDDKYQQYNQLSQYYYKLFRSKAIEAKKAANIKAAWGGEESPYSGLPEAHFR